MAGGGGSGGLGSFLPMALAIGATIATDGAAAPMLGEAMGAEAGTLGATMLGAGAMGAGTGALGGIMQGQSGGDILKNSLTSGLMGAGTAGILGGLSGGPTPDALVPSSSGTEMNAMVNPSLGNNGITLPPTSDASLSPYGFEPNPNPVLSLNSGLPTPNPSITTPFGTSGLGSGVSSGMTSAIPETVSAGPGSFFDKSYIPSKMAGSVIAAAPSVLGGNMFAQPTLGAVAGTQKYSGPLSKFKYDPENYSPDVVTPPNPLYSASYPNYRANPYGAAQGGIVGMADGGTVEQMSRENSLGGNQMFPQSGIGGLTGANTYQNATNTPMANNVLEPTDAITDPYTGQMKFAPGGIAKVPSAVGMNNPMDKVDQYITAIKADQTGQTLQQVMALAQKDDVNALAAISKLQQEAQMQQAQQAQAQMQQTQAPVQAAQGGIMGYAGGGNMRGTIGSYSDGGQMLKGPGDGMSDSIPAKIGKHQPARLADSEFVVPADVVSHLGNGSTDAGAKQLYAMMDRVRTARTGRKTQGKQIKPEKYMPA
jgi:hypothetical protein